jgi:hypothetical protein
MLLGYGFGDVWHNQSVNEVNNCIITFSQRVKDVYQQEFYGKLNESSKSLLYRNVIECYEMPHYIKIVQDTRYRQAITKIRTCNHKLRSETGRWQRPPVPFYERKCNICDVIEDEYHMVLVCQKYKNDREKYIKRSYFTRPSMYKMTLLLNSTKKKTVFNLGIFLYKNFKIM